MTYIFVSIFLLTDVLKYIIIFDVILSWLTLLWLNIKPKILKDITDIFYKRIKKYLPTVFGPFEFTPFIAILVLIFIQQIIILIDPNSYIYYRSLLNF